MKHTTRRFNSASPPARKNSGAATQKFVISLAIAAAVLGQFCFADQFIEKVTVTKSDCHLFFLRPRPYVDRGNVQPAEKSLPAVIEEYVTMIDEGRLREIIKQVRRYVRKREYHGSEGIFRSVVKAHGTASILDRDGRDEYDDIVDYNVLKWHKDTVDIWKGLITAVAFLDYTMSGCPLKIYGNIDRHKLVNKYYPTRAIRLGSNGPWYYISNVFTGVGERKFFVTYHPHMDARAKKQKIYVNVFYKSNSHDVWRVASHRSGRWIGKGVGEFDQAIPIEIQGWLEKAALSQQDITNRSDDFYNILGSGGRFPDDSQLDSLVKYGNMEPDGMQPIQDEEPEFVDDINEEDAEVNKIVIGKEVGLDCKFTQGMEPDFYNGIVGSFKSTNQLYGDVDNYIIRSSNGRLTYLFKTAEAGRLVWIGTIQTDTSEVNRQGVRIDGAMLEIPRLLLRPAYDYHSSVSVFCKSHPTNDTYADYSLFLDTLSVIQQFRIIVLRQSKSTIPRGFEVDATQYHQQADKMINEQI